MATDVNKAIANAKKALANANAFTKSTGDTNPSMFAAKPTPKPAPAAPKKPGMSLSDEAGSAGEGIRARMQNVAQVQGSFKKGGKVKETGVYKLHEGETVIPADKSKNLSKEIMDKATSALGGSKKPKKKLRMVINQTDDDRFHVQHSYSGGEKADSPMEPTEHAPSSIEELLAHVKQHYAPEEKSESEPKSAAEKE